jgi:hypothetical protein
MKTNNKKYNIPAMSPYVLSSYTFNVPATLILDTESTFYKETMQYFLDLKSIFMDKLEKFAVNPHSTPQEEKRIKELFHEIIKVKRILEEEAKTLE